MPRLCLLILTSTLAAGVLAPAPAGAVNARTATELYLDIREAERVPAGWTGDTTPCRVGKESKRSVRATLVAVNALRRLAGLKPVRFATALNRKALAAAQMMRAANASSHSPDPDWPCYSRAGAAAAGVSNLMLGASGAEAVVGYVDDVGVPSLGHRRWVLDPRGSRWGTGSTGTTNTLLVAGATSRSRSRPVPAIVAWPPAGAVPWPFVFEDWSASFAAAGTDLAAARVRVEVDGEPRPVSGVRNLGQGFGEGTTLGWRVGLQSSDRARRRRIAVTITYRVANRPKTHTYVVDAVHPSSQRASRQRHARGRSRE